MSEIEKMYKTVGIEPKMLCDCEFKNLYDYSIEYGSDVCEYTESNIKNPCKTCKLAKQIHPLYPEFTAEKQLAITKLIGIRYGLKFITNEGMDYMLSTDLYNTKEFDKQGYGYGYDEAIANLINNLWQDLTEQERTEIAEILRG